MLMYSRLERPRTNHTGDVVVYVYLLLSLTSLRSAAIPFSVPYGANFDYWGTPTPTRTHGHTHTHTHTHTDTHTHTHTRARSQMHRSPSLLLLSFSSTPHLPRPNKLGYAHTHPHTHTHARKCTDPPFFSVSYSNPHRPHTTPQTSPV